MRLISDLTCCYLIILSLAGMAHPQVAKSELIGEVRDQNGALVPNAKASLTDVTAGQTSSKVSPDGSFIMTNLKPGIYNVAVEAAGFKQSLREGVRLATGERVRLDIVLDPGAVTELVTVVQELTRVANPFPVAQILKPFPRFTNVTFYRDNVGNTNYNALQAKLEQRFTNGLSFLVSYTRSKLIDEASSVFDASILTGPIASFPVADSFNRKLERDLSTGDIPNVFVASFTYDLPIGKGKRFNPGGLTGTLLSGWELAGVIQLQSGIPLAVTQVTVLQFGLKVNF